MTPGWRASLRGEVKADASALVTHAFGGTTFLLDTPRSGPERVGILAVRLADRRRVVRVREGESPAARRRVLAADAGGRHGPFESYSFLLHGWFFVDAGRKLFRLESELAGRVTDESSLRREWNRELMTAGTLLLIPVSLLELQRGAGLSAGEIQQLVAGVAKTVIFTAHLTTICSDKQCVYRWRDGGPNWELIGPRDPIVELAAPKGNVNPADALPSLKEAAGRLSLALSGWPRLAGSESTDTWPEQEVADVLASAEPGHLFAEPGRLEYVAEFCTQVRPKAGPMRLLLRRLLARPLKELGERADILARLLNRVPADQRLAVPIRDEPAGRVWWTPFARPKNHLRELPFRHPMISDVVVLSPLRRRTTTPEITPPHARSPESDT